MKKRIAIIAAVATVIWCMSLYVGHLKYTVPNVEYGPGSRGSDIEEMQSKLENWGYLSMNEYQKGFFDKQTEDATKQYQQDRGLEITGIATLSTLREMGIGRLYKANSSYAAAKATAEQLLARAINGEARGEPYEGQVAVGSIILNRVRDSRFPSTIAGVIYQPYAFTSVNDGQINYAIAEGSTVLKAARDALNGWDPTWGCLYFWNPSTATSKWIWSRRVVRVIGKHYFGI